LSNPQHQTLKLLIEKKINGDIKMENVVTLTINCKKAQRFKERLIKTKMINNGQVYNNSKRKISYRIVSKKVTIPQKFSLKPQHKMKNKLQTLMKTVL
jgi:hypothetical protein